MSLVGGLSKVHIPSSAEAINVIARKDGRSFFIIFHQAPLPQFSHVKERDSESSPKVGPFKPQYQGGRIFERRRLGYRSDVQSGSHGGSVGDTREPIATTRSSGGRILG